MQNRRHFLKTGFSVAAAGLAGAAALVRARGSVAEEAPPETTSVRLLHWKDYTCLAPIDLLDDLLRDEGFADVRYVPGADSDIGADRLASGDADFVQDFAATNIPRIDAGVPAVMLAGVHPACFELFAHELIRSVVDLKGKTVGVSTTKAAGPDYFLLKIIAASVGLDPARDINWIASGGASRNDLLTNGKIDAFMASPPWAQELRGRGTGHVILNSELDRPWSQYFCCMLIGSADFVRRSPIATKRSRARHDEGHRHLRRQARLGCPALGRSRPHGPLQLRAAGAGGRLLSRLARLRRRGRSPFLGVA